MKQQVRRKQAAEAVAGRQAVEARLADLELLLPQRQLQRESGLHERREVQQHNQTLQQDLQALRLKAEQERVAQEACIRGVEDRAHREVDHAREEGKAMTVPFKAAGRQVEHLHRRLESIQTELSQTQQRAAAEQARAETLEQQLTQSGLEGSTMMLNSLPKN